MTFLFKHKNISALALVLVLASCKTKAPTVASNSVPTEIELREVKTGAENSRKYLSKVKHKKAGIVTNQTGIVTLNDEEDKKLASNQQSIVDFFLEHHINVAKIYAPEHGFRGTADAGELIKDGFDTQTGLPIISLYGDNKKPKPEQLAGIEVMIFDLQDVGVRFYTYISSLHFVMEACAENDIPLIVLDRPNPNINIIDGPILEKEHTTFVGMHPVPVLHGMTIGEYAKMINGEKWLANGVQCELTVVPCANYHRNHTYSLPVKPSPNLPNDQAINLYASLCFFEGTNVSVGRGTDTQFQIYGSPYLPIRDFYFVPKPNLGSKSPLHNGKICFGENLTTTPKVSQLELKWLLKAYENTIDKSVFFTNFFPKLAGSKKLQEQIINGVSEEEIRKSWVDGLEEFKKMRQQYLIYE